MYLLLIIRLFASLEYHIYEYCTHTAHTHTLATFYISYSYYLYIHVDEIEPFSYIGIKVANQQTCERIVLTLSVMTTVLIQTKQTKTITAHRSFGSHTDQRIILHEFNIVLLVQFMFICHVLAIARPPLHWRHMEKSLVCRITHIRTCIV